MRNGILLAIILVGAAALLLLTQGLRAGSAREAAYAPPASVTDAAYWAQSYDIAGAPFQFSSIDRSGAGATVAGWAESGSRSRPIVLRLDDQGAITWQKQLDLGVDAYADAVATTGDGGAAVAGYAFTDTVPGPISVPWLGKLAPDGSVAWLRAVENAEGAAFAVAEAPGGDLFVAGEIYDVLPDRESITSGLWLARFDSAGSLLFQRLYSSAAEPLLQTIVALDDGGVALAGIIGAGLPGAHLARLDAGGNVIWWQQFPGTEYMGLDAIAPTGDGGLLAAGWLGDRLWLVRVDGDGAPVWQHSYRRLARDEAVAIVRHSGGYYVIAGRSRSQANDFDTWLLAVNDSGAILWQQSLAADAVKGLQEAVGGALLLATDDGAFKLTAAGAIPGCGLLASTTATTTTTTLVSSNLAFAAAAPTFGVVSGAVTATNATAAATQTCSVHTFDAGGHIARADATPLGGVPVSAGAGLTATSDAAGVYTITGLLTGTYTLTPTALGYTFSPPTRTVTVPPSAADADFVATPCAGPDVAIGFGALVTFTWAGGGSYDVYRAADDPYFLAGAQIGDNVASGWAYDEPLLGDPAQNAYYAVGDTAGCVRRLGEFDFALTPGSP